MPGASAQQAFVPVEHSAWVRRWALTAAVVPCVNALPRGQVVYKAGRPAEDIYFVVRGRILLREGRSATAATAPSAPPPGAIAEPPSGAAPSGGSGGTASTTSTATLGGAPAAGGSDMTDPDASVDVLAGSWFGEAELLAGCKRKYTAEAAENGSVVLKMPAQAYMLCMVRGGQASRRRQGRRNG